jgi:hypothetical protein
MSAAPVGCVSSACGRGCFAESAACDTLSGAGSWTDCGAAFLGTYMQQFERALSNGSRNTE